MVRRGSRGRGRDDGTGARGSDGAGIHHAGIPSQLRDRIPASPRGRQDVQARSLLPVDAAAPGVVLRFGKTSEMSLARILAALVLIGAAGSALTQTQTRAPEPAPAGPAAAARPKIDE